MRLLQRLIFAVHSILFSRISQMIHLPYINPDMFVIAGMIHVRWYGFMYLLGFVSAWFIGRDRGHQLGLHHCTTGLLFLCCRYSDWWSPRIHGDLPIASFYAVTVDAFYHLERWYGFPWCAAWWSNCLDPFLSFTSTFCFKHDRFHHAISTAWTFLWSLW